METTEMLSVEVPSSLEAITISQDTPTVDEGSRVCPLCGSLVKLYYLNLQEQLFLCENDECTFPFGEEELQFIPFEDRIISEGSVRTKPSQSSLMSPTGSIISTHAWSEIEKINKVYESEDSQLDRPVFDSQSEQPSVDKAKRKKDKDSIAKMKEDVEHIRGLNKELMEMSESKGIIKNERWIKKLLNLQGISGSSLLKPQELKQLQTSKKSLPDIKIDIQPGDNNTISSIKIGLE